MRTVEFWFDFASTYSYLSAMRIDVMAQKNGLSVAWRPFLLGPIFGAQGWNTSPFNIYPAKGAYMWRDMERLCAARGLPLVRPDPFPQNSLLAARVAMAAGDTLHMAAYCREVFVAEFSRGEAISDPGVLGDCLTRAELPTDLIEKAQEQHNKNALRAQTDAAQSHGIFGAPTFRVGAELFWGDDRLPDALEFTAPPPRS
ncbi:MAG: 2-hydroxychromene-2-carboxylate isomerase [Pseudomonadota bacterium]